MEESMEISFIKGLTLQLQYLYQYLEIHINQSPIEQEGYKLERLTSIADNQNFSNLNDQISQCRKQKLLRENELTNKPKKPVSSFVFYFKQKVQNGNHPSNQRQVCKLAKIISLEWKKLSSRQKYPYEKRAMESKRIYQENMKFYNKKHENQIQQIKKLRRMTNNKLRKLKRKKQFRSISKNFASNTTSPISQIPKPKYPLSSFFQFSKEKGQEIRKINNQTVRSKLAKLVSQEWHQLDAKEKERYELIARKNKEEYDRKLEQYKNTCRQIFEKEGKNFEEQMLKQQKMQKKKSKKNKKDKSRSMHKSKHKSKSKKNKRDRNHSVTESPLIQQKTISQNQIISNPDCIEMISNSKQEQGNEISNNQQSSLADQSRQEIREKDSLGQPSDKQSSSNSLLEADLSSSQSYIQNQTEDPPFKIQKQKQQLNTLHKEQLEQQSKQQQNQINQKNKRVYKQIQQQTQRPRKRKKSRNKNSSHKPKVPISSFFLYYSVVVRELKKEFPTLKGCELVTIASERWAKLAQEQKQIYQQQYRKGRELYNIQMQKFMTDYPEEASKLAYFKRSKRK